MDGETQRLIERIHAAPTMAVLAIAGAGAPAVAWLLSVPGASRTVLEVLVPYASTSLADFLGHEPRQFVDAETAADMAHAAYRRAVRLRRGDIPVAGIACTATIATNRPKRGKHRCHVASWSPHGMRAYNLEFIEGLHGRAGEDEIVSKLVVRALAKASRVNFDLRMGLDVREPIRTHSIRYQDPIEALLTHHVDTATVHPDGTMVADRPVPGAILSGSFNPLHEGYERLAAAASNMLNASVAFELSVANVDKPALEHRETLKRVAQLRGKSPVVATRASVFWQKARLFPGCTFVVGWDTAIRLVHPRYYGNEESKMLTALEEIRNLSCRFLVAGRAVGGVFHTLDDVVIPKGFQDMFTPIPESVFRYDLSSTDMREADIRLRSGTRADGSGGVQST